MPSKRFYMFAGGTTLVQKIAIASAAFRPSHVWTREDWDDGDLEHESSIGLTRAASLTIQFVNGREMHLSGQDAEDGWQMLMDDETFVAWA